MSEQADRVREAKRRSAAVNGPLIPTPDPNAKRVTEFKLRGWTFRLITDPTSEHPPVLEQLGADALGAPRWDHANLDELHDSINLGTEPGAAPLSWAAEQLVREVAEAVQIAEARASREALKVAIGALAQAKSPRPALSVSARTLLARAYDEWENGDGLRGVIEASPVEVFELVGLTRAEDIEALIGDRGGLRA